jgi:hypothetical protein
MTPPRSPSRHDDDDPPSGGGNGNSNGGDHGDDLGRALNPCKLGDDCPYAGSMRWLFDERLKREQTEGQIVSRVDILADKLQGAILLVEKFERTLLDLRADLDRHIKTHRLFELAVLALAAAFGGFLARWFGGK